MERYREIPMYILGGGQCVGANSYYLKLGGSSVLLDCGMAWMHGVASHPDFYGLLYTRAINSLSQLSHIFISHAHMDHVGALCELLTVAPHAAVHMTELTRILAEKQLRQYSKNFSLGGLKKSCSTAAFGETLDFGEFTARFLPAGHIPGAMMTLLNYRGRKILYTGDYTLAEAPLAGGAELPLEEIDTLIMCGMNARRPGNQGGLCLEGSFAQQVMRYAHQGLPVWVNVSQLSKGIELLTLFNSLECKDTAIYVDKALMDTVHCFEDVGIPLLQSNNRLYQGQMLPPGSILIGRNSPEPCRHIQLSGDFSLHDDFFTTLEFIKRVNPKKAVIVHSPPSKYESVGTLEQYMLRDPDCRTQFIFPENGDYLMI